MAQNSGTLIINTVRPNDSLDNYPVAFANELKGGIHSYETFDDLSRIPTLRRTAGMLVSIHNDINPQYNNIFKLMPDLVSWEYLESKFIVTVQLDDILSSYLINILLQSPYIYRISKVITKLDVGTCNLSFIKNNTTIVGLNNIPVSTFIESLENVFSEENYIEENDNLKMVIFAPSANFSSLSVQIELTRILPKPLFPSISVCGLKEAYINSYGQF